MPVAIITGSAGLVGAEAVRFFHGKGFTVAGVDNDMRRYFFGDDASTEWSRRILEESLPGYRHFVADIRDPESIGKVFKEFSTDVKIVVHTAGQPSHEWANKEPTTDFHVNAVGTLVMLEQSKAHAPDACFIFTSTNKVYGDSVNFLPFVEMETRWELAASHPFHERGVDENFSIDQTTHSLFGASKTAADLLVQEYGRYFGMKTACFRGGCITGPGHSGAMLHGFLAYLAKCCVTGAQYTINGFKGKQVRDNIHAFDLVNMFWHYSQNPRPAAVYNVGGGRASNCSLLEAARICESLVDKKLNVRYSEETRVGDHRWWISDVSRFRSDYPGWDYTYDTQRILEDVCRGVASRACGPSN